MVASACLLATTATSSAGKVWVAELAKDGSLSGSGTPPLAVQAISERLCGLRSMALSTIGHGGVASPRILGRVSENGSRLSLTICTATESSVMFDGDAFGKTRQFSQDAGQANGMNMHSLVLSPAGNSAAIICEDGSVNVLRLPGASWAEGNSEAKPGLLCTVEAPFPRDLGGTYSASRWVCQTKHHGPESVWAW